MSATASRLTYPASYSPKTLNEQVAALRSAFPEISTTVDGMQTKKPLPEGAEAYFAIPRWQVVAPTYGRAVEAMFEAITKQRKLFNYREGKLGPDYLRQSEHSVSFFERLNAEHSDHDILVVPAQFGLRHKGRSVSHVREVFLSNEFGLGAFAVGAMLLTHPERFTTQQDLCVDCPGDKASPDADGDFSLAPRFDWYDGEVRFYFGWPPYAFDGFGTVSGFVSQ